VKRKVKQVTTTGNLLVPMGSMLPVPADKVAVTTQTDYCGNVIYENGVLSRILVDGGYITMSGTTPTYHYYIQDHQGNNRVVFNQNGTIEQTNHYYPFGMTFGEGIDNSDNRYKYNNKELDRMHGLDLYGYGARHLDASIGRWGVMDPLAEKHYNISPYAYCSENPVNRIDPDGRDEFLLTWLPKGDAVGHSAVAIEDRDSKGNLTGYLVVRHLWPEGGSAEVGKSKDADYRYEVIAKSDLASFNGGEGRGADGIIKINGDAHQDNVMSASLDLDEKYNSKYEMPNNDCATYTKGAVESVGINGSTPSTVTVEGATSGITYKSVDATTPGSVHNAVAKSGDKRVEVLKPLPKGNGNPNIVIEAPDKVIIKYFMNFN